MERAMGGSESPQASSVASRVPVIRHLEIERFRGIRELSWYPGEGVNVVLGGGDTGKSTILDAIGLLLSPTNPAVLSDSDYYGRDVASGFRIQTVFSLPFATEIGRQVRPSWPWAWDGLKPVVPAISGEGDANTQPVYWLRVRGTEDLELVYELLQPDGEAVTLSVGLRRAIGLVRLTGDDRNDRDLRLVQGSALDRLLFDKALRSRLTRALTASNVTDVLQADAKEALAALDISFASKGLPNGLDLSVTGTQGASIAALVGLTANRAGVPLPLASWGAGTRRLAALTIAEENQGDAPVVIVDEIERGLEPYRQRTLMNQLQGSGSQAFITTHSPSSVSAATSSAIWYLDAAGSIGRLDATKVTRHLESDPETFLARLALVAEGATEVGFVEKLLERALGASLKLHGIHVTDGGGHETALGVLEALASAGLRFGGFADDENGKHPEAWRKLEKKLGPLLFRWRCGCLEKNLIDAVPDARLQDLVMDPEGVRSGERLRTLATRLEMGDQKDFDAIRSKAGQGLRDLIIAAATGTVPKGKEADRRAYKSHAERWFKSFTGGQELAGKMFSLGAWSMLKLQLMPFCNTVRQVVGQPEKADLV